MSGHIKQFSIRYEPLNESSTFTGGDVVNGRVVLQLNREVKVVALYVKCKGEANVHWTESNSAGESDDSYSANERFFKFKQIFIWDHAQAAKSNGAVLVTNKETYNSLLAPGYHEFPFTFQLPNNNTPSSFKGCHGSIKYVLEARLSRSWKMTQTATREFTFLSKFLETGTQLMLPLSGAIDKKMKLFTSGSASVRASIDKMGYRQGETIKAETQIENSSSRSLKLKFKLEQRQTFTAQSHQNYSTNTIFKAVEDPIPSRAKKNITSRLKIPPNLDPSITNCGIIKVEYTLKVYLDVPYARDPEIVFPVVILPANQNFPSLQNQTFSGSFQDTQDAWRGSPCQPGFGLSSSFTSPVHPSAPVLYPSPYTAQASDLDEPPPSYTDIFPDSNPSNHSTLDYSPTPGLYYSTPNSQNASRNWQSPDTPDYYPSK